MDTNLKDRLIQERFPTIMAPRYEAASRCARCIKPAS